MSNVVLVLVGLLCLLSMIQDTQQTVRVKPVKEAKRIKFNMRLNFKYVNASIGHGNTTHSGAGSYYLFQDIPNLMMVGTIKSLNMGQVYYNRSWDFCCFSKSTNKIPILNDVFQNFKKAAKFDLKCPFRKGLYNVEPQLITKPQSNGTNFFNIPIYHLPDDEFLLKMTAQAEIKGQWQALIVFLELWKFVDVEISK